MKHSHIIILIAIACILPIAPVPAAWSQTADNVLLVVNDNSQDSRAIARYYAEKRKLPAGNIFRLRTAESESISRDAFEREILRRSPTTSVPGRCRIKSSTSSQPAAFPLLSKGTQAHSEISLPSTPSSLWCIVTLSSAPFRISAA